MQGFKDTTDKNLILKVFLFLVSPFVSFLVSLKDISSKSSYIIFICFCLLFGLNFNVTDDRSSDYNLDGSYYRALFERDYVNYGTNFHERLENYLSFSEVTSTDIYADFISFIVSRFTGNYHLLFFVYALVFTFFMAKSLKYLLKSPNYKNGSIVCFLLFLLFIVNDIFNINGVRFWTAAWVAVYALLKYYVDKKKWPLLLILSTPLIHASFVFFVIISAVAIIFNKFASNLRYLLLFSIIVSPLMLVAIQSLDISGMPVFFSRYFELYASDEAVSAFSAKRTSTIYYIISTLFSVASLVYINILVLIITKSAKNSSVFCGFSNYLIIFIIFCNLSTIIPSVGTRFIVLSYPIIAFLWLNLKGIREDSIWIKLFPLFFFMTLRSKLLLYTEVLDGDFYYMNLISLIIKNV